MDGQCKSLLIQSAYKDREGLCHIKWLSSSWLTVICEMSLNAWSLRTSFPLNSLKMVLLEPTSKLSALWNGRLIIFTLTFASPNESHKWLAGNKTKSFLLQQEVEVQGVFTPTSGACPGCILRPLRLMHISRNLFRRNNDLFCSHMYHISHFIFMIPWSLPWWYLNIRAGNGRAHSDTGPWDLKA